MADENVPEIDPYSRIRPGEKFMDFVLREEREAAEAKVREYADNRESRLRRFKERIILDYNRGKTFEYMDKHYGVRPWILKKTLVEWGVPKRRVTRKETWNILENKSEMIKLYREGWTAKAIADKYGIAEPTVQLRLKSWGVKARTPYRQFNELKAIELVKKGVPTEEIAHHFNVSDSTILKLRVKHLGHFDHPNKVYYGNMVTRVIYDLYQKGFSVENIFKYLKIKGYLPRAQTSESLHVFIKKQIRLKRRPPVLSVKQHLDIERMIKEGLSMETISFALLIPKHRIDEYLGRAAIIKYPTTESFRNRAVMTATIRRLRRKGYSMNRIMFLTGVAESPIKRALYESGSAIVLKKHNVDYSRYVEAITKMRAKKMRIKDIAERLKLSTSLVQRIILEYKIPYENKIFDKPMVAKVKEMYDANIHPREIARKLGVKEKTLMHEIQRYGILRLNKPWNIYNKRYSDEEVVHQNDVIRKYYDEPYYKSVHAIARFLGMDKTTVQARLKNMGFKIRTIAEANRLRVVHKAYKIKVHPEVGFVIHKRKMLLKSGPVKRMLLEYKGK